MTVCIKIQILALVHISGKGSVVPVLPAPFQSKMPVSLQCSVTADLIALFSCKRGQLYTVYQLFSYMALSQCSDLSNLVIFIYLFLLNLVSARQSSKSVFRRILNDPSVHLTHLNTECFALCTLQSKWACINHMHN